MVFAITSEEEFKAKLTEAGDKTVVVDFHATWCGPCKMIAPFLVKLDEQHENVMVLKVDVDEVEEVAAASKVSAMPTFVVFKNGIEVDRLTGANKDKLEEIFKKNY